MYWLFIVLHLLPCFIHVLILQLLLESGYKDIVLYLYGYSACHYISYNDSLCFLICSCSLVTFLFMDVCTAIYSFAVNLSCMY